MSFKNPNKLKKEKNKKSPYPPNHGVKPTSAKTDTAKKPKKKKSY